MEIEVGPGEKRHELPHSFGSELLRQRQRFLGRECALFANDANALCSHLFAANLGTIDLEGPQIVSVENGEYLKWVAGSTHEHPVENLKSSRYISIVDGISEIPWRDIPGVTKEWLNVRNRKFGAGTVDTFKRGQNAGEPTHISAQVIGKMPFSSGVESNRGGLDLLSEPFGLGFSGPS
jgi:hypothetical protein